MKTEAKGNSLELPRASLDASSRGSSHIKGLKSCLVSILVEKTKILQLSLHIQQDGIGEIKANVSFKSSAWAQRLTYF